MGRQSVRTALVSVSLLLSTVLAEPVHAQPTADVMFEGTHEAGGPVRLTASADGARIVAFEVEGVAGGGCSWDTITLENWGGDIQLLDGRFSVANADGDVLRGAWVGDGPGSRRLEGTIQVHDPVKGCETPPLRWAATSQP